MENKVKYGLKFDEPSPEHWVLGGGNVPFDIVEPTGDWLKALPPANYQNKNGIEPYMCVIMTLFVCAEALIFKKYGERRDYSRRFLATVVDTRNGGTSPQKACEILRKVGAVKEELWPFDATADTFEKFFSPIPAKLYELAREFNAEWDFRHEFVIPTHDEITRALKTSPLMMSVYAWVQDEKGLYYKPEGATDNHATTLVFQKPNEYMQVFDSYADGYNEPSLKEVRWDALPVVVKRFWIEKKLTPTKIVTSLQRKWYNLLLDRLCKK